MNRSSIQTRAAAALLGVAIAVINPRSAAGAAPAAEVDPVMHPKPFSVLSPGRVGVLLDPTQWPEELAGQARSLTVRLRENGELLDETTLDDIPSHKIAVSFDLPGDPQGRNLELICRVTTADGETVEVAVEHQVPTTPEWRGRFDVPDDFVPDPWTALELGDDTTIACWGRRYVFGRSPFPQQILVGDTEILSGPMRLLIDGKPMWNTQPVRVESRTPARIVLSQIGRVGGIGVVARTTIEFDGFVWCVLRLEPQRATQLDQVQVTIPIRDEVARFFHVDGKWAEKRWGAVAERSEFPATLDERHYYWLGNDDVGLCWMTDGLRKFRPAEGGRVRVGFREGDGGQEGFFLPWSQPDTLREPLELRFGLQATPTRPTYHRLIRPRTTHNTPPDKFTLVGSPQVRTVVEVSLKGKFNYPPYDDDAQMIQNWIDGYHARGITYLAYQYISGEIHTEPYDRYWGDWLSSMPPERFIERHDGERGRGWTDMCLNSSYSDFYLHNIDIMTREFGADGVYLDGTIQERICERGDIHGPECVDTWPLLASREHLKKLRYLVQKNRGAEAFLWGHTSDIKIGPLVSLMDIMFEGENYGLPHSYDAMTPAVLRSQFGRQWGVDTIIMPQLTKRGRHQIPPERFIGAVALHGVQSTDGFLTPEARERLMYPLWDAVDELRVLGAPFRGYWEQEIVTEATGLPVSLYLAEEQGRCLVVIANQSEDAATYQLRYHADRIDGGPRLAHVTERLSGDAVPCAGDRVDVSLGPWEFALLDVQLD